MTEVALDRLERWFLEVITHPEGVAEGAARTSIDDVLRPSEALSASERVGIYAGMYFSRLIEVLEDEFPALCALLGDDAQRLLREYLIVHPSRHPNLNQLGRLLPAFLESEATDVALEPKRAFAAELARLERGIQEVFDARGGATLATDDLLALSPEEWSALRLRTSPTLRLLDCAFPTNTWFQSWKDGETAPAPDPKPSWLALYRRDFKVWRLPLTREQHVLLAELTEGRTLAEALEALATTVGSDLSELGTSIQTWFRDWTGLGFFSATE